MGDSQEPEGTASVHSKVSQPGHETTSSDSATQEKAPKDPNIVDWDGPDDPANPMNWSSAKKIGAIIMVAFITMIS
jgi:hypothetical protein